LIKIRQAESKDVASLVDLIEHYAVERVMLPRTQGDIRESIAEFLVAEEKGNVLGCGALKLYSDELAEIRSLCVAPGVKRGGVGSALTKQLIKEAEQLGVTTVFALTLAPGFFLKCGFRLCARENFPMKISQDCASCELRFQCREQAVALRVPPRPEPRPELAEPVPVSV
jgi:amino-acid N-acetyltransferase